MIITDNKVTEIINKDYVHTEDMINLITKYIFDFKQIDISNENINPPVSIKSYSIMIHMFNIAKDYYVRKQMAKSNL